MTMNLEKIRDTYFNFWVKISNYKSKMKLLEVDFNKPWWDIIWRQKTILISIWTIQMLNDISWIILPIVLAWVINDLNYLYLAYFILFKIALLWLSQLQWYINAILQLQSVRSVYFQAHKFFLTVDPIYHSTKNSGKILAKTERGSRGYEDLLDILTFEIIPIIIGIVSIFVSMLFYNTRLAFLTIGLILLMVILNIAITIFHANAFEQKVIDLDDSAKNSAVENLSQANLIRSAFATTQQLDIFQKKNLNLIVKEGSGWNAQGISFNFVISIYFLSVLLIGYYVINNIQNGTINSTTGLALLSTYLIGTNSLLSVGGKVRRFMKVYTEITDLYSFIRTFGKQTYPVLEGDKITNIS